jgi:carbonic anhydrase
MDRLLAGYKRFRANGWPEQRRIFESLAENGQAPQTLVVACVDSRVDPTRIFDTRPGEMLTVRNVASLVPPYAPDSLYHGTSAALEFGVRVLEIPHIVVMGHGLCGGVKTLVEGAPMEGLEFIAPWMSIAKDACAQVAGTGTMEERRRNCEFESVKVSLRNLMSFPWVAERVAAGKLKLHGTWFDIRIGELMVLQADGKFEPQGYDDASLWREKPPSSDAVS